MLIECTIPELDNLVTSGATTYHFRRIGGRSTPMLCDVVDTSHAADILARPDFKRAALGADAGDGEPEGGGGDGDADHGDDGAPGEAADAGDGEDLPAIKDVPEAYAMDTIDDLRTKFRDRFGRAAHPQAKFETLLARLVRDDADKAAAQLAQRGGEQGQAQQP